jgi:hypothetical protein
MRLRYKILSAMLIVVTFVVAPAATWLVIGSADAPPPEDADLLVRPPAVPEEENAFPLLLEVAEARFWLDEGAWLDGPPPEGTTEDALADGARLDYMTGGEKWDEALAEAVLARNREALALLDRAMARPHLQLPQIEHIESKVTYIRDFLGLANLMALQSRAEARGGRTERACETALETVAFGDRLERGSNSPIIYLVGLTARGLGLELLRDYAAERPLPAADLRRAADRLAHLMPRDDAEARVWRTQYRLAADAIDRVRRGELPLEAIVGAGHENECQFIPQAYCFHPNRTKRLFAETYGAYCEAARKPYWETRPDLQAFQSRMKSRHSGTGEWWSAFQPNCLGKQMYVMMIGPMPTNGSEKADATLTQRVTRLMLLLRAWKAEHGRLPESLDALVPAQVDAVPLDPFDGRPIRYDREKRILYSVGEDGADTGGLSDEEQQTWWKKEYPYGVDAAPKMDPNEMPDPSFSIRF